MTVPNVTALALCVLELLHEQPMHPYEMHRTMWARDMDSVVKLKAGSLYHAVERLHRLGLVDVAETERRGRRPERTLYRITAAGRERYARELPVMLATVADEYPAFPLALALGDDLDRETMVASLQARRSRLEQLVEQEAAKLLGERDVGLPERYSLDLRCRLAMRRSELAFVDELIGEIERGEVDWDSPAPEDARL